MRFPRDWHPEARVGAVGLARLYSNLVSPPVMFAVLGMIFALDERPGWGGFAWGAAYGLLVSLTPILFVLARLRSGAIRELHMTDKGERTLPYLVSVGCAALMLLLVVTLDGPELLRCLSLFNVIQLAALGLINVTWLISIHATAMTATLLLAWVVFGAATLLITVPLYAGVVFVRLFLRRHTPAQLIAGTALSAITIAALVWGGCFA